MLQQVREHLPQARRAITYDAEVNAPMLAINRQLGFAPARREAFYQLPRAQIGAWLAARGA